MNRSIFNIHFLYSKLSRRRNIWEERLGIEPEIRGGLHQKRKDSLAQIFHPTSPHHMSITCDQNPTETVLVKDSSEL